MSMDNLGITVHESGGMTIDKPLGIELYRLLTIRSALKIEINTGLKMARGRSAAAVARTYLTLPARNKVTLLAQFEKYIETWSANNGLAAPSWTEAGRG